MKLVVVLPLIISMLLSFACCSVRRSSGYSSEVPSVVHEADSSPSQETSSISLNSDPLENVSSFENVLPQQSNESAVFSLMASEVESKTMKVGDTIGQWTLTDLQITYFKDTNNIKMLESLFSGEVTLNGTSTRSNILDNSYDFLIAEEDRGKMPKYISPDVTKDVEMFMLNIPEDFEDKPNLEHGEQMECKITINSYKYIFAYMVAPSSATLVSINS